MSGIGKVLKVDLKSVTPDSRKPKDVMKWAALGGTNPTERMNAGKVAFKPLPYDGPVAEQKKAQFAPMTAEEEADVKRRRRRPNTVLSAAGESDSLGG